MGMNLILRELYNGMSPLMQHYVAFTCPKLLTRQFVLRFIPLNTIRRILAINFLFSKRYLYDRTREAFFKYSKTNYDFYRFWRLFF